MDPKILIIIPAYNESENIEKVVDNIVNNYPDYDYIIVNDCSTDNTEGIIKKRGFNYVSLPTNLGIGGGVQTGYLFAVQNDYDIAVQIDGDGQHDPAYIKKLIQPILDGQSDITIGSRFIDREGFQTSAMRRLGINIIGFVIKLCCGVTSTDATSGFRASNREATKFFSTCYAQDYPEPEAIVEATLNGYKIKDVSVVMRERENGVSSINLKRSVYYMIKVLLALVICRIGTRRKGRK